MKALATPRLADPDSEQVRRIHEDAIREIQRLPVLGMRLIPNVQLSDGVATPIAHGLGRAPLWVGISVPRLAAAAGYVVESRDGVDRSRAITLTAHDYLANVLVDVVVL